MRILPVAQHAPFALLAVVFGPTSWPIIPTSSFVVVHHRQHLRPSPVSSKRRIPQQHRQQHAVPVPLLYLSSSDGRTNGNGNGNGEQDNTPDLLFQRQDRVQTGYQAAALVYGTVAALHLVRKGIQCQSLYYVLGGGPASLAGLSLILKGATRQDRLSGDTYKRLNLLLIGNALLSLALPVVHPGQLLLPVYIVPSLVAFWTAFQGYAYSVTGWDKSRHICAIFTDLQEGLSSTWKILRTLQPKSLDYILMGAMVGAMAIVKGKETLVAATTAATATATTLLGGGSASTMLIAARMSRLARLGVVSGILLTLKDAADRDRLGEGTFRQLNGMVAAAFVSMAGYLLHMKPQHGVTHQGTTVVLLGLTALLFSGITAYNGYSSKIVSTTTATATAADN